MLKSLGKFQDQCVHVLGICLENSVNRNILCILRYIYRCLDRNEQRGFPAHELLHHPFISPSPHSSKPLSSAANPATTQIEHKATTCKLKCIS